MSGIRRDEKTYPRPGPKKGVKIKRALTGPLDFGINVSESDPGALANTGAHKKPVRNRKKHKAPKLWTNPAPMVKKEPRSMPPIITGYRPIVSERGPPITGPRPRATT